MTKIATLLMLGISLAGCTNMSVFKDNSAPQPIDLPPDPAPMDPAPMAPTAVSAGQIKTLLTGKSWRWVGPKNSGVTLYASDGTSLVEVSGKGTTGGKWQAKDGQLCESFTPAKFIPQGVPMTCQPFTKEGGKYKVGQATFAIAS